MTFKRYKYFQQFIKEGVWPPSAFENEMITFLELAGFCLKMARYCTCVYICKVLHDCLYEIYQYKNRTLSFSLFRTAVECSAVFYPKPFVVKMLNLAHKCNSFAPK